MHKVTETICPVCGEHEHFWRCDSCGNYFNYSTLDYEVDYDCLCEECFNKKCTVCALCNMAIYTHDAIYDGEYCYCSDCASEIGVNHAN